MGVGDKVSMDERGRITIPSEIRNKMERREFDIRLVDRDTIILKAVDDEDLLEEIRSIELKGDPE
jgi:bifunctional DNA-binding transcriptional regulator/antitoxin component of YhaV-PrlF toxin-antitoxin module